MAESPNQSRRNLALVVLGVTLVAAQGIAFTWLVLGYADLTLSDSLQFVVAIVAGPVLTFLYVWAMLGRDRSILVSELLVWLSAPWLVFGVFVAAGLWTRFPIWAQALLALLSGVVLSPVCGFILYAILSLVCLPFILLTRLFQGRVAARKKSAAAQVPLKSQTSPHIDFDADEDQAPRRICEVEDCGRPAIKFGWYCPQHHSEILLGKPPRDELE